LRPPPQLVVFVISPGSTAGDAAALVRGFEALAAWAGARRAGGGSSGSCAAAAPSAEQAGGEPGGQQPNGKSSVDGSSEPSSSGSGSGSTDTSSAPSNSGIDRGGLTPRAAFFAPTECVPLAAAAGRLCAELLCPYPPGVPLLFPGERVTAAAVAELRTTLACGGVVVGASDGALGTLLVVADEGGGGSGGGGVRAESRGGL
jgi:hypothetical protein